MGVDRDAALSYDECLAWGKKYASTPFSMLALSTAAAKDPGPMTVMRSLFEIAAHLTQENDMIAAELRDIE